MTIRYCSYKIIATAMLAASLFADETAFSSGPGLKVSENRRFLVTAKGEPFFWLGDTAWELFHRLSREDADRYLEDRAKKGFTVIQAVALAEMDNLKGGNIYGHRALRDLDPTQPDIQEGPANDYWDHVDHIVAKANSLGIYVGFLPTWGDKWNKKWGAGPEIFTPQNAEAYGEWLGKRYKNAGIVWILGGDRPVENDTHKEIIRAMARGLRNGDGGTHLITFHPTGGSGSSVPFHNEEWLDFNMRQNGHQPEFTGRYDQTRVDYDRTPIKPVLDGEPIYEGHPVSFDAKKFGHSVAADVRRPFYWNVFTGACGHTYGHHSVWSMHGPKHAPFNAPLMPWTEAIHEPGAMQVGHGRRLIESRPFLTRVPDDSVLVPSEFPTLVPGAGTRRFVATRDQNGGYVMVYAPVGRSFQVRMDKIAGPRVKAWWFNPRDGEASVIGEFENQENRTFTPPMPGELLDWVLVLDDVAKGYPPPGTKAETRTVSSGPSHRLAVEGSRFVMDGKPFSYTGLSFFNAIYNPAFNADSKARTEWLKKFQGRGINVLRVWCQWDSGNGFVDSSPKNTIYDADGSLRPAPLATLKAMLADADSLGMCLEIVLFSQESFLAKIHLTAPADERAVAALAREVAPFRNAVFQIWNEHTDDRVRPLIQVIKGIDPERLVTNSPGYAGDLGGDEENRLLDYLTPHTTRAGRYWEIAPREIGALRAKFGKPVVDDEPARNGTARFGGPQGDTSPFDQIVHITNVWRNGGYPTYHHDMFQTGYGTPSCPPTGIPDPEFNPYHRTVFEFLSRRERLAPIDR
jgi:hypothetical protein